jgi:hypothetical protein
MIRPERVANAFIEVMNFIALFIREYLFQSPFPVSIIFVSVSTLEALEPGLFP